MSLVPPEAERGQVESFVRASSSTRTRSQRCDPTRESFGAERPELQALPNRRAKGNAARLVRRSLRLARKLHLIPVMSDQAYLTRAVAIAVLMLGSIATVVITAEQSPTRQHVESQPAAGIAELQR